MLVSLRKKQEAKEDLDFLALLHLRRLVVSRWLGHGVLPRPIVKPGCYGLASAARRGLLDAHYSSLKRYAWQAKLDGVQINNNGSKGPSLASAMWSCLMQPCSNGGK